MRTPVIVAAVTLSLLVLSPHSSTPSDSPLDTSALYALLDVVDAIMDVHPDYEGEAARIDSLEGDARADALAEKRLANERSSAVTKGIDALLSTTAYRLYFSKFRFTRPETHRDILLALPYDAARGPADVSDNLMELCRHRGEVRAWVDDTLARIDPAACVARAAEWLPPGDYKPVPVRFIYDGNGDAFASFGGIVFDVFSVVLRFRPPETRFEDLDGVGLEEMEKVIAHEYHHVLTRPLGLKSQAASEMQKRNGRVAGSMVSEGVALLCDLGPGLRRDVMEDRETVQWWIDALNEKLTASQNGTLSDDDWNSWLGSTYGDLAMDRLRDYLARTRPGDGLDARVRANAASRPMLVYTLGWYMVNRILDAPDGKDRVIALLDQPYRLFAEYDRTLTEDDAHLRVVTAGD